MSNLQITFFFFLTLRKEQGESRRVLGFMAEAIPAASEGDALGQEVGSAPFSSSFLSPSLPLLPSPVFPSPSSLPRLPSPSPSFEIWPLLPVGLLREGRESATRGSLGCPGPAGRSAVPAKPTGRGGNGQPGEARGGPPGLPALGWELAGSRRRPRVGLLGGFMVCMNRQYPSIVATF